MYIVALGVVAYIGLCIIMAMIESRSVPPTPLPICMGCGRTVLGSGCFVCLHKRALRTNLKKAKSNMKDITPTNLIEN